jgi:hypothetical protein
VPISRFYSTGLRNRFGEIIIPAAGFWRWEPVNLKPAILREKQASIDGLRGLIICAIGAAINIDGRINGSWFCRRFFAAKIKYEAFCACLK